MEIVLNTFMQYAPLSEPAQAQLASCLQKKEIAKNALLLPRGQICKHIYFLEKGFVRGFHYQNGKDITTWFAAENEVVTSLYSFLAQKPTEESIEAFEDSVLYSLSYDNLQQFYQQFPEFNFLGRVIIEKYYIELEERAMSLQFHTAKERYQKLFTTEPYLLRRASLGHIASYLGMSQETLSRIRGKI